MNGYEYVKQLKAKITESPTHSLSLQDSLDFIKFYGLRNLIGSSGDMRFVGQVAIDVLDKALSDELIISKDDLEQKLFSYVKKKSFDDNVVHEIMQELDCMKDEFETKE